MNNSFNTRDSLQVGDNSYEIFSLRRLAKSHDISRLPCTLRILLENLLRYDCLLYTSDAADDYFWV